jgi:hypothetical protein
MWRVFIASIRRNGTPIQCTRLPFSRTTIMDANNCSFDTRHGCRHQRNHSLKMSFRCQNHLKLEHKKYNNSGLQFRFQSTFFFSRKGSHIDGFLATNFSYIFTFFETMFDYRSLRISLCIRGAQWSLLLVQLLLQLLPTRYRIGPQTRYIRAIFHDRRTALQKISLTSSEYSLLRICIQQSV